jgi:hypothetical protein
MRIPSGGCRFHSTLPIGEVKVQILTIMNTKCKGDSSIVWRKCADRGGVGGGKKVAQEPIGKVKIGHQIGGHNTDYGKLGCCNSGNTLLNS